MISRKSGTSFKVGEGDKKKKQELSVDKNMCYVHTHMHDLGAEQEKGAKEWNFNTYMRRD